MTDPKLRRRYVYMSDDEWDWLKEQANWPAVTISSVVRSLVGDARQPLSIGVSADTITIDPPPARGRTVSINSTHPADSAPVEPGVKFGRAAFSDFRPAPKPGPRKQR